MIVSGLILLLATHAGQAAPTTGKLIGATVQVNGATAVRLRWVMDEGWIPNGGFNIYRTDGATTTKLNSAPLGVKSALGLSDKVYQTAVKPVRITGLQSLLAPRKVGAPQSSAATFAAMRTTVKSLSGATGGPATVAQIHTAMNKTPAVVSFMSALPKGKAQPKNQVLAGNDQIAMARSHLAISSMALPGAADALGTGFDDTKAVANATYTYTLKDINNGTEAQVATFNITVGKDPLPPAPLVEEPVQTGVGAMSLHLEVPQGVDEASYGLFLFKVTRTDSAHPTGLVLSKGQIIPTYTTTSTGVEIASLVSYIDQGRPASTAPLAPAIPPVAIGNVTYSVQLFDAFGRNNGAPVSVSAVEKDIAPPGPVNGATATYQPPKGVGGQPFVLVHFTPSVGDVTMAKPNPADVSYVFQRRTSDDPNSTWTNVTTTPVALAYAQETGLGVREMSSLYPSLQAPAKAAAQKSLTKVAAGSKSTVASKLVAVNQMTFSAFRAANAEIVAPSLTFPVGEFADQTVQPDHYYQYQIIPVLKRNSVAGNMATTSPVGIAAVVKVPAPSGLAIADAVAPQSLKFAAAATNVLKLQSTHGIYAPGSLVATGPSLINGAKMAQTFMASRLASSKLSTNLVAVSKAGPVAANYGRMETISWALPSYSSAVSFKVYRANGTGYTSNIKASVPPNQALNASAEGQVNRVPANRTIAAPVVQNPKAVAAGLSKAPQKPSLVSVGAYRPIGAFAVFALDSPPPLAAYSLLGQTAPGATQFVDLIPRSQSNVFYYYVVPVNRWGAVGTTSAPVKVKVLPSLPPSVPAILSASPTETETVAAGVQPNVTPEDVVEYRLYRMPFPASAAMIAAPAVSGILLAGKVTGVGATTKAATTTVSRAVGARSLIATGTGIAGGAKFGILQTESPAVSLGTYQAQFASSIAKKTAAPTIPLALQALFAFSNYQQVGSTKVDPTNTAPVYVTDSTAVPGTEYVYRIVAVDAAGLVSEPSTVMDAMAIKLWCDPPTLSGQAIYTAATNTVSFSLAPPASGCQAFVVERAIDPAATKFVQLKMFASNGATPVVFSDTAVRPGQTYTYHVSCIDSAGNTSKRTGSSDNAGGAIAVVVKT